MPRKSRRLGPLWSIPGKKALKARWVANRPAMLARSQAGTEASKRTYAARLILLKAFVATWPDQLTMQNIKERIEANRHRGDKRSPDSIVRRMREHNLVAFDLASGLWQNLCRVASPDDKQNL